MKTCKKCLCDKDDYEFCKNRRVCKICYSKRNKEYYSTNKSNINQKRWEREKTYIDSLSDEERIEYNSKKNDIVNKYREKNPNSSKLYYQAKKDIIKIGVSKYKENNKDKINLNNRERYRNDNLFKLSQNIRNLTRHYVKRSGFVKRTKTVDILGCSLTDLKSYLESKFDIWMSWENHGKYNGEFNYGWDIDHIIPISTAKTEEDIIRLSHYTNLQPLCSKINRDIKRNKLI